MRIERPKSADAAAAAEAGKFTWARSAKGTSLSAGQQKWMDRLKANDLTGMQVEPSRYLELVGEELKGSPRSTSAYQDKCLEEVGLAIDIRADHFAVDGNSKTDRIFLSRQLAVHVGCVFLDQFLNFRVFQRQLEAGGATGYGEVCIKTGCLLRQPGSYGQ